VNALENRTVTLPDIIGQRLVHSRHNNSRNHALAVKAAALLSYDTRPVRGALPAIPKRSGAPGGMPPVPSTTPKRRPRSAASTPGGRKADTPGTPATPAPAPAAETPAAGGAPLPANAPAKAPKVAYEREDLTDEEAGPALLLPKALSFGNPTGRSNRDLILAALLSKFEEFLRSPTEPVARHVLGCIRDLVRQDKERLGFMDRLETMPQRHHVQNAYLLESAIIRKLKSGDLEPAQFSSLWLNPDFGNEMLGVASPGSDDPTPVGNMQLLIQGGGQAFKSLCELRAESFSTNFCWLLETQSLALVLGLAFVSRARRGLARQALTAARAAAARGPRHGRAVVPAPRDESGAPSRLALSLSLPC